MSSRATRPLAKVTTRASPSRRVSVTKPGARRRCTAPTSRSTAPTSSARAMSRVYLRIVAMACLLGWSLAQADGFDVVAVGIDEEGGVVARAVIGAQAGLAVVAPARVEPGAVKAVDRGALIGAEGDMRAGSGRALAG